MITTYTIRHKSANILWVFQYDLNGCLKTFKVEDHPLTTGQADFLFAKGNFPVTETVMKTLWMTQTKSAFEIIVGAPDLSFEAFWNTYNHKVKRQASQKAWERLSKKEKIEALKALKAYDGYLKRKGIAKAHGATFINQRYWEDSFGSIH